MVLIKVNDDDIKIISNVSKDDNLKRVYDFPLNKTLRVDLDEGKVEGLQPYQKPEGLFNKLFKKQSDNLDKVYIHGQIVEDYPAMYVTLSSSLSELKKSIQKVEDEDIMEDFMEVRDKNNKKIQQGGSMSKKGGYRYRKKGGMNILKLSKMMNNIKDISSKLVGLNNKKDEEQVGGSQLKKDIQQKMKEIIKLSSNTVNKGFEKLKKLGNDAILLFKGGSMKKFQEVIDNMKKEMMKMKKNYIGGMYCGGSQCGGKVKCVYCKKAGSNCNRK